MAASNVQRLEQTTQRGVELLSHATEQQRIVLDDAQALFDTLNGKGSKDENSVNVLRGYSLVCAFR